VTRTWDENRETINDLWPLVELREEERKLWHDDLSPLDQATLYDALREVKRSHDSPWPQLSWILAAYRELRAKARASRPPLAGPPAFSGDRLDIDPDVDRRVRRELEALVHATPVEDLADAEAAIWSNLHRVHAITAMRLQAAVDAKRAGSRPADPADSPREARLAEPQESPEEIEARRQTALRVFNGAG
jgi:hypothetical protein